MSTVAVFHFYPCDRGTGTPVGYHHYQLSAEASQPVCIFCGKVTKEAIPGSGAEKEKKVKILMIWATDYFTDDAVWMVDAWDEYSIDSNQHGWKEAVDKARLEHGSENIRIITAHVDEGKVIAAFEPIDVGVLELSDEH